MPVLSGQRRWLACRGGIQAASALACGGRAASVRAMVVGGYRSATARAAARARLATAAAAGMLGPQAGGASESARAPTRSAPGARARPESESKAASSSFPA
jgi:hypothetical protein